MTEEQPSAPMKPQDTVIFLLGELKGGVSSLKESVDSSAASQAQVNLANEQEHAKFRTEISSLNSDMAVLKDSRTSQRYTKSELTQRWMVYAGLPATLLACVSLFLMIYNK